MKGKIAFDLKIKRFGGALDTPHFTEVALPMNDLVNYSYMPFRLTICIFALPSTATSRGYKGYVVVKENGGAAQLENGPEVRKVSGPRGGV